jgi:hypothetical protein
MSRLAAYAIISNEIAAAMMDGPAARLTDDAPMRRSLSASAGPRLSGIQEARRMVLLAMERAEVKDAKGKKVAFVDAIP